MLAALCAAACGQSLDSPPVELTVRDSLVGAGKVLQVGNTSDQPLAAVRVKIRAPDGSERSFTQEAVPGYGGFEVGWKKLGGWEIPAGAEVTVRAEGYLLPFEGTLPDD
jgi:hypothetical protein